MILRASIDLTDNDPSLVYASLYSVLPPLLLILDTSWHAAKTYNCSNGAVNCIEVRRGIPCGFWHRVDSAVVKVLMMTVAVHHALVLLQHARSTECTQVFPPSPTQKYTI